MTRQGSKDTNQLPNGPLQDAEKTAQPLSTNFDWDAASALAKVEQETQASAKLPPASKAPPGGSSLVEWMIKHGEPLTRANYLELAYGGNVPNPLSAEEESEIPSVLRDK